MTDVVEPNEETKSMHQEMMDKAYELWNDSEESKKMSYENFLNKVEGELGKNYVDAVMTGNMNYQVGNGGWSQWNDNAYSCNIEDLLSFFKQTEFDNFPEIKDMRRILDEVEETLDWIDRGEEAVRHVDYDFRDIFEDAIRDSSRGDLNRLDSKYYKIGDKVMEILEQYFVQKNLDEINGESNK